MRHLPSLAALLTLGSLALGTSSVPSAHALGRGAAVDRPVDAGAARASDRRRCPSTAESRLRRLGLRLPPPFVPAGTYVNAVRTGGHLILGGHVPITPEGDLVLGRLGEDLDVAAGQRAARLAALSALATIRDELGSLDRVRRVVSVFGVVNATPQFTQHTQVVNGASDVFVALWGRRGQHTRLAVGFSSLPANLALEITMTVEVSACRAVRRSGA